MAERLKHYRESRFLTQAELGEKAGVSWKTISAIERGVEQPRFKTLRRLAEALEITPQQLVGQAS